MLQQEAANHTLVKAEASSNGAMDTTTPAPQNFVAMTTATSMTVPEPMDVDPTVTIPTQQVQGLQQTAVPRAVTPQMFASRGVSVAPLQTPGNYHYQNFFVIQSYYFLCLCDQIIGNQRDKLER